MGAEAERVVRLWRAAEMFTPRPLPEPAARDNVVDVAPGDALPWERQSAGRQGRHAVFGGLFRLGKVRGDLDGESALFTCVVDASGALTGGLDVSECAWAAGQLALGDEASASGDPSSWLTASSGAGRLPVARENLPDLPDGPLTMAALSRFAAELAELLGVTEILEPSGIRVHSYQAGAFNDASPLAGYFAAELARVDEAVRQSAAGLPLLTFLRPADAGQPARSDIRRQPLIVRDGCSPDRIPAARWPSDAAPVLSEQFAVNEILGRDAPLSAVDGRPAGIAAVFNDLIAAIVTERARVLAGLESPDAAFGTPLRWGSHQVAPLSSALAGFEILVAAPADVPGLGEIGAGWREHVAESDYFAATARLADGDSGAMIRAHLGDPARCRAFAGRFWHGRLHGSDALFSTGDPMRETLLNPLAVDWPDAVADFRSALADVELLSSERMSASVTFARFSAFEQECEDAYSCLEEAEARVASLGALEPDAREAVIAAEERRRAALEDLRAHQADRPGLAVTMSTGMRAGREWYAAHSRLRAAFDAAARDRDSALSAVQELRASLAASRKTMTEARAAASRLATSMGALQAPVASARKRWGAHMPEGPSYAETEDAALIERRENSAPWADPEFADARARLFLAALTLHKSLIHANAPVMEANLAAWTDMVSGSLRPPTEVALAAWRSFFLTVPVVSTTFSSLGAVLEGLGRGSVGWLLAAGTGGVPPRHVAGALWRAKRAVLAGTVPPAPAADPDALSLAANATRFGTCRPDGTWTGLPLYPRRDAPLRVSPAVLTRPAGPDRPPSDSEMLHAVLSDLRHRARSRWDNGVRGGE